MKNLQNNQNNSILPCIERIANTFKDSQLTESNKNVLLSKVKEDIKIVSQYLHCQEDESWIFAVLFAMSISGKDTDLDSFTQYLSCNPFLVVSLTPVLEKLVNKRLLIKNSGYDLKVITTRYHISSYVFNAISQAKPIPQRNQFTDVYEVIERINEMIADRERNNVSTEELMDEVKHLLIQEKRFPLVKKVLAYEFSDEDTLLLVYLCYAFANESNEADIERYIYYVYESMGSKIRAKKTLFAGQSRLMEENLVSFVDDSFYGGKELALTDKAIEHLFAEDLGVLEKAKSFYPKNFIVYTPDKIHESLLYFNPEENTHFDFIGKLLEENNFQKVLTKFEALNMPKGITVLLYGSPGTGKTQLGYNWAKTSNRNLMMVDISAIRDKYVGESEKRIKQIFKTYKQAVDYYDQCPILFFNESDALISKRYEVNSSVDQMNNSMQNILLQELEDFEGILIATSNLNKNLDNAFERRFLYKIHVEKPDTKARVKIWKNKMPQLNDTEVETLAEQFILTGGQINNITRKYLLENILNEATPNLKKIEELCEQEYFGKQDRRLGFNR